MPIVVGKSVSFLLTKFTPKADQIYPYPRLRIPALQYLHGSLASLCGNNQKKFSMPNDMPQDVASALFSRFCVYHCGQSASFAVTREKKQKCCSLVND